MGTWKRDICPVLPATSTHRYALVYQESPVDPVLMEL